MEKAEIIDPGFSVADAEDVSIATSKDGLVVEFTDWQEKRVRVLFIDAAGHRWDRLDWKFLDEERFDSSHIIHNSNWIEEYLSQHNIEPEMGYIHYRLNFNAEGTLQVLARGIKILGMEAPTP